MICVSIGRTRHKMVVREHQALAERGAELVEIRLDWVARSPDLGRLLKDRPTPTIVACRRREDRGRWSGDEKKRLALLRAAIVEGVEYVDLEDDVAGSVPRYGDTKRIVSHHNFDETPDDIEAIHKRMTKLDPDVVKIVTMANSPVDVVRMLTLVSNASTPTVGFCMGDLGVPSRLLCGKFGSPFTYSTFHRDRELAPGQIPFDDMRDLYHYDSIGPDTQVYGVLGDPIGHSLSPLIHNAAFRDKGLDCVYLPLRAPADALSETIDGFSRLGVRGYSVTIPHKQAVVSKADAVDESVREIGAANTLYKNKAGAWEAANTDLDAALTALRSAIRRAEGKPDDGLEVLAGRKLLMLGAGGVARAIGTGLVKAGAALTVTNRTSDRAAELAEKLNCKTVTWENRGSEYFDVLINCTSVGMYPEMNNTPFPEHWLREGMYVFDTVYNPENTLLLKQAKQRDCRIVTGLEMFTRQAAAQFELFTGGEAPLKLMAATALGGVRAIQAGG